MQIHRVQFNADSKAARNLTGRIWKQKSHRKVMDRQFQEKKVYKRTDLTIKRQQEEISRVIELYYVMIVVVVSLLYAFDKI